MSEPQYANYKDIPRESLGLMSNEIWQRDPKMLGIHLARYKFVAKMLAGKDHVAEIGCGDGFYSRVVGQEIGPWLRLYDFDKDMKPYGAIHHNILDGPIGTKDFDKYDAIYSLDVWEHIKLGDISIAMKNVCNSLKQDGVFIVGMPSLESQKYASEASKKGHVSCRSLEGVRYLLRGSFKNVFMFGMNDETLHTGFGPMCHYLLGVCCGVR